jgi:putative transposase
MFDRTTDCGSHPAACWAEERKINLVYIEPWRPMQNGHVESFHGHLRDECLNANSYRTMNDVRGTLDNWRREYNCERPRSALAYNRTPAEFRRALGYGDVGKQTALPTSPQPGLRRRDILAHNPKPRNSIHGWMRKPGQVTWNPKTFDSEPVRLLLFCIR